MPGDQSVKPKNPKNQRAGLRGVMNKLLSDVNDLVTTGALDALEGRLLHIQNTHERIEVLGDVIVSDLVSEEEILKEYEDRATHDEEIFKAISVLKRAIADTTNISSATKQQSNTDPSLSVKLPKLSLPRFNGNLTDWLTFWDVFESTVHNTSLDNVRKFHYLKGQLDGEALHLIEGFAVVGDSYMQAVQLLEATYGDREQLKVAHILSLLNLEQPRYRVDELTKFRADLECHTRSLETLKITAQEIIITILRQKLPLVILDKVRSFDLKTFKTEFSKEISNLQLNSRNGKDVTGGFKESGTLSLAVETKGKNLKNGGKPQICKFCNSNKHKWVSCQKYNNNSTRIAQARKLKLCVSCLSKEHGKNGKCTANYLRPCRHCRGHHFDKLCPNENKGDQKSEDVTTLTLGSRRDCSTTLPTIKIPVEGASEPVVCRVLLDQASQRTFIKKTTLDKLRYRIVGTESLRLQGFTGVTDKHKYDVAEIFYYYRKTRCSMRCVVVENLPDYQSVRLPKVESALRGKGLHLSDPAQGQSHVDILLGADHYYDIVHPGFKKQCGVVLIPTKFGFCISGKVQTSQSNTVVDIVSVLRVSVTGADSIVDEETYHSDPKNSEFDLERLWRLDHIGIDPKESDWNSQLAIQKFEESVSYSEADRQYTVSLPWKTDVSLPTNYGLALGRLRALQRNLAMEPEKFEAYDSIFRTYLERGFIEQVDHNIPTKKGRVHYLAHHGVKKDSPTTPIRVVFDCSARVDRNPSLNDCLLTGPSMVSDLSQQLLRFRIGKYAFVSDIEKAFLMVKLNEQDRDVTRFLWVQDIDDPQSPLVQYRFKVVLFGATCSQFLLNATIRKHLTDAQQDTEALQRGLYIDNLQYSNDCEDSLLATYAQARKLFSEAHLYLREWVTNSEALQQCIERDGTAASNQTLTRNLGMDWYPLEDVLAYPSKSFAEQKIYTKRSLLSKVSQFFDPLGLLLPVTIRARLLMQEIWRRNIDWDSILPMDLNEQGYMLLQDYDNLCTLRLPRKIAAMGNANLHAFCDASTTAYGVAVYVLTSHGTYLLTARAKVAPVKKISIPKMELTAMLLLSRLVEHVRKAYESELAIDTIHVWCDSQVALNWIYSNKTLPVYVRNRVDEIRSLLPGAKYHYVNTKDNPSDLITRGLTADQLMKLNIWWKGPQWLCQNDNWTEWKAVEEFQSSELVTIAAQREPPEPIIVWARFGCYTKLLRVVAWVQRYILNLRQKVKGQSCNLGHYIHANEIKAAERILAKCVQRETFFVELQSLKSSDGTVPNLVRQLKLHLDNDLIRCEGRIKWSTMSCETNNPILMPASHHVTRLLIQFVHEQVKHFGVNHTIAKLRLTWWVPRLRQVVRSVIRQCIICKRLKGKPYRTGPMPALPEYRVNHIEPFRVTGLDYTGALRTREEEKVYILLFTCATSRAIHLELCENMSCEEFVLAFRRFCARRSFPQLILSDNAPTFLQASKYLKSLSEDSKVINLMGEKKCDWKFVPVRAPWFGGIWERCVGIVKSALRAVIGRALLRKTELITVLTEVEATVNDRPLTYVYTDLQEPLPLTPAHLLYGKPLTTFPSDLQTQAELDDPSLYTQAAVSRRYRYITKIIEDFKIRWKNDYLLALRERSYRSKGPPSSPVVGDIVLIHDEGPRVYWKLGRVLDIYKGEDSVGRVVLLKTATGTTVRPVARLYSLELDCEEPIEIPSVNAGSETESVEPTTEDNDQPRIGTRSRRAAHGAMEMWRHKIASGQL